MFKVGSFIVYKKDVCKIKEIKEKDNVVYYVLNPIDDDSLTITVCSDNNFLRDIKLIVDCYENKISELEKVSKK